MNILTLLVIAPTFFLFPLFGGLQYWLCKKDTLWFGWVIPIIHILASVPLFFVLCAMIAFSDMGSFSSTGSNVESESSSYESSSSFSSNQELEVNSIWLVIPLFFIFYHCVTVLYFYFYVKEKKNKEKLYDLVEKALGEKE